QIGFALAPSNPAVRLQHIEFVALEGTRVLVIVVAAGGHVTHRIIDTDESYTPATLSQAANYINSEFAGMTLQEAREAIVSRLREERMLYDQLMKRAITMAETGLAAVKPEETLFVQGASFLIDEFAEESADPQSTLDTLRVLFHMIEEKHHLIDLLTRSI